MKLPRHMELWLPGYLQSRAERLLHPGKPKRLWVTLADHYEPMGGNASLAQGLARVDAWHRMWPGIAANAPRDAAGKSPVYTFFYPQEEYQQEVVESLEPMHRAGIADVDVHIHHDGDTHASLRAKLQEFLKRLRGDHGFLREHHGQLVFGFIHGNWALDNSRPDGRWCGVTGELQLLRELGCYADFTMPSLPSPTQGRVVNRIYWSAGDRTKPRGFDVASDKPTDGLLMVPGPLGLRFRGRLMPRIETGELAWYDLPTPYRVAKWIDLAPRVGDDIYVKLYGHSAREDNAAALLGSEEKEGGLTPMFRWIAEAAAERGLELHWASAFEMYRSIEAAMATKGEQRG